MELVRTEAAFAPVGSARGTSCGLYVHVPFCETKCGYCDFFSVPVKGRDMGPLVRRVQRELRERLAGDGSHRIGTVFLGGGTPTVLPDALLASLLGAVGEAVATDELVEYTVEANPATVTEETARILVRHGVTRVSMGAQSFHAAELATLERLHSPEEIAPSVSALRRGGAGKINLDLIFGVPGQTLDTWSQSLARAIALQPDHIACYGLTYEPGTRLTAMRDAGRMTPCDPELEAALYGRAIDALGDAGYEQYEISNFARPGCESQHNLLYWRNEPYIGVGPSAAGCADGRRYKNVADVNGYVRMIDAQGHAEVESEVVDTAMLMTEMVMMQLRLVEGLSIESFRRRTGADALTLFAEALARHVELGFVTVGKTHIALTRAGRLVGDAIIRELAACCEPGDKSVSLPVVTS
ncbi:MAG: radical SAM family heme chaperone HemW [Phycisphaerae bacterium]